MSDSIKSAICQKAPVPIQLSRAWCQKAPLPVKGLTYDYFRCVLIWQAVMRKGTRKNAIFQMSLEVPVLRN